jgi:hypothetical protein
MVRDFLSFERAKLSRDDERRRRRLSNHAPQSGGRQADRLPCGAWCVGDQSRVLESYALQRLVHFVHETAGPFQSHPELCDPACRHWSSPGVASRIGNPVVAVVPHTSPTAERPACEQALAVARTLLGSGRSAARFLIWVPGCRQTGRVTSGFVRFPKTSGACEKRARGRVARCGATRGWGGRGAVLCCRGLRWCYGCGLRCCRCGGSRCASNSSGTVAVCSAVTVHGTVVVPLARDARSSRSAVTRDALSQDRNPAEYRP